MDAILLGQVRHKVVGEGVLEWVEEERLREELGGSVGVLRMMLRGYLVAGAKSFTHMITALERYCATLQALLQETGQEARLILLALSQHPPTDRGRLLLGFAPMRMPALCLFPLHHSWIVVHLRGHQCAWCAWRARLDPQTGVPALLRQEERLQTHLLLSLLLPQQGRHRC